MIVRVFPEHVARLWPQISPLFADLIAQRETHADDDVRLACMGGAAHLWVQWGEPGVDAAYVTEFAVYPRGAWLRVWLGGARNGVNPDHAKFAAELREWAAQHGCCGLEAIGRAGWARLFPAARIEGIAMRLTWEK